MITKQEAELAVQCAAFCSHRDSVYVAHSLVYTKNPRGNPMWCIVLHDLRANSTVQAPLSDVTVVRWNLPAEMVERLLKSEE